MGAAIAGRPWWWAVAAVWAALVVAGFARLADYQNTPGQASSPPLVWPDASALPRAERGATMLLFVHPRCPCSSATIGELDRLLAQVGAQLTTTVAFVRPPGTERGFERTGLWDAAARLPSVRVVVDIDGVEARRFGAVTSGQALVFDRDGRLAFAGGVTGSRGHAGDNLGRAAAAAAARGAPVANRTTPVYGCPLFAAADVVTEGDS